MSLLDTLPYEITEIIYKKSLEEHFQKYHENFVQFHFSSAKKRLGKYHIVRFTSWDPFNQECRKLFDKIDSLDSTLSIRDFQDRLYWILVVNYFILSNAKLLKICDADTLIHESKQKIIDIKFAHFW
jgi:hypothetical protein